MGAKRRIHPTRERFERVMSASFECPLSPDGTVHRKIRIGTMERLTGRHYRVHFTREFIEECRRGVPYSLTAATELRQHPATLDVYLAILAFAHRVSEYDEFTHEYPTCERIPLPAHLGSARRALIARLDAIRGNLRDTHATVAPRGTGILIDIGEPKRTAYVGGSPQTYRQREEIARATRAMAPEERRRFGHAVEKLTAYESKVTEPNPWPNILVTLQQAKEHTARALAKIDTRGARWMKTLDDDTTGPIER